MPSKNLDLPKLTLLPVKQLKHIEGFSQKRAELIEQKILSTGFWTKPLCIEQNYSLVLDGQHRMEAALSLGLEYVPSLLFDYSEVDIKSLRKQYTVSYSEVIDRALRGTIYPYKTVKHYFPIEVPVISIPLERLFSSSNNHIQGNKECESSS